MAIIDSEQVRLDTGEALDGAVNEIPLRRDLTDALTPQQGSTYGSGVAGPA